MLFTKRFLVAFFFACAIYRQACHLLSLEAELRDIRNQQLENPSNLTLVQEQGDIPDATIPSDNTGAEENIGAGPPPTDDNTPAPKLDSIAPTNNVSLLTTTAKTTSLQRMRKGPQRVILATWVFGESYMQKRRFRMFLETVRTCGLDVVIIGDAVPPYELPPNAHHFLVTWDQLVDRVVDKVFPNNIANPNKIQELRDVGPFKVCDFRPLMGYLFPEIVEGYQWWGYTDNDVLLGDIPKFFPEEKLKKLDILSGSPKPAWGAFMLYRNAPITNSLFLKAKDFTPLEDIFLTKNSQFFDEEAQFTTYDHENPASMGKIIQTFAQKLGLKWQKQKVHYLYDKKECMREAKANQPSLARSSIQSC